MLSPLAPPPRAMMQVLWPLMAWDHGTRSEGADGLYDTTAPEGMARLQRMTGADGLNGDTLSRIPYEFYTAATSHGTPPALQPELGGTPRSLNYTTLEWAEAGGWSMDLTAHAPLVALNKWLQPKRMLNVCRRWDQNRRNAIQHAWFNGIGYDPLGTPHPRPMGPPTLTPHGAPHNHTPRYDDTWQV